MGPSSAGMGQFSASLALDSTMTRRGGRMVIAEGDRAWTAGLKGGPRARSVAGVLLGAGVGRGESARSRHQERGEERGQDDASGPAHVSLPFRQVGVERTIALFRVGSYS